MVALALTLPVARRSPTEIPQRNLVLSSHDSLALALTLVASDHPAAAAVPLSGIGPRVRLSIYRGADGSGWEDYGWGYSSAMPSALWSAFGVVDEDVTGRVDIEIPRGTLGDMFGPLLWAVQLDYQGGLSVLARGVLQLLPGLAMAEEALPILDDTPQPILAG